jgi:histidine ammonia-lyase
LHTIFLYFFAIFLDSTGQIFPRFRKHFSLSWSGLGNSAAKRTVASSATPVPTPKSAAHTASDPKSKAICQNPKQKVARQVRVGSPPEYRVPAVSKVLDAENRSAINVASKWMIANIASDDALILPHHANLTGLNFRERQASMGARHRFSALAVLISVLLHAVAAAGKDVVVALDGKSLTFEQVIQVAAQQTPVAMAPSAMERVDRSYDLVIAAAEQGMRIYGLTVGVGENKDRPIIIGPLTPQQKKASTEFNINNLRATSAGAGPDAPEILVRAAMLIRLNTMLVGQTGAQRRVAELYRDFLNKRVHPVLPTRGSVGEADITILAHIGLAMMGEGEVIFAGQRMSAKEAFAQANIGEPLQPFGKDSLAIMSSNAYAAALAVLTVREAEYLLESARKVFALSLEALNGNVSPFLERVHSVRPYPTQGMIAEEIRKELEGSFLWECKDKREPGLCDESRALQDPLSYRTASHVLAVALDAISIVKKGLLVQINSSDDNPAVIYGIRPDAGAPAQVRAYYVEADRSYPDRPYGAVIPTANFEPLPWVVPLEASSIALSHVSRAAAARITRLGAPEFTKLTRFLTPDEKKTLAYSAIQKVYAALDAEIQALSGPVSTQPLPLAGDIEDTATSSVLAASRLQRIVDNLYGIVAIELMHAAQAIDLRLRADPSLPLGAGTRNLFKDFRGVVPFLDRDRPLTPDIAAATRFIRLLGRAVGP